jgi:hypothetical protein
VVGQDIVEVPEPAMLLGDSVHEIPMDGDAVAVRATTPANPFRPVTVIVEFPAVPTTTLTVAGFAPIVKSWTM